jgi:aryl-alcohol dehydrogenase-like predicted oxidoreductase
MMTRVLGRSGIEVSALGMGCWAIGGPFSRTDGTNRTPMGWGQIDDNESIRAIHRAVEFGINLFDTANNYGAGHSERIVGKALAGKRDKVIIGTKFGSIFDEETKTHFDNRTLEATPEFVREACEGSLRRLNTDYIDLYQLHWGSCPPETAEKLLPILEDLVREGKIRWYGWSTDDPERARVFAQGEHCTAIQHRHSLTMPEPR